MNQEYSLHVYLEDSDKVKELSSRISDLENSLKKADEARYRAEQKALYFIQENIKLTDELRELRGSIRNNGSYSK